MDALKPAERGGLWAKARDTRHRARRLLEGNLLTLVLALVVLLTMAVGVYMVSVGLYAVGYLAMGEALWLDIATYGLMGLLGVLLVLPSAVAVWRLACLFTVQAGLYTPSADLPIASARPTPEQLFYPFTSLRAYGRTLAVGLETLGWTVLTVGIPAMGYRALALTFADLANRGLHTTLCTLLTGVSLLLCIAFGVLMLFLSGRRAGFGFFVFAHEVLPLAEVRRYFKGFRRGFARPFILRISLTGWIVLSVVAILVPFVIHTAPYALCCSAIYATELERA